MRDGTRRRETRDRLICDYRSYVEHLVGQLIKVMRLPLTSREEFMAAGYLGLVEAAHRFKRGSGADFKTFAYLRVRGAVIDCIRQNSALSDSAYRYARAYQAVQHIAIESDPYTSPGTAQGHLAKVLDYAAKGSLAFRLSYHDFETELSATPDPGSNPEKAYEWTQTRAGMLRHIRKLNAKERHVIESYYFKDLTLEEIADKMNVSKSWISRLHDRALGKLREAYHAEQLH